MSPLVAAQADCAERTASSQQKSRGLPSVPMATEGRLLQSTQPLPDPLPQGSITIRHRVTRWRVPVFPPSATPSPSGIPVHGPVHRNGAPPLSRSVTRLRAILRRLGTTAQASGNRIRIRLTAEGLARAKAALLQAGSGQQVPVGDVPQAVAPQGRSTTQHQPAPGPRTTSLRNKPRRHKPESMGSGGGATASALVTATATTRDRGSVAPQSAAVQPGRSKASGKAKPTPTATKSPAGNRAGKGAPDARTTQATQKRPRHGAQSPRTGAKGVYTEDSIRVYLQEIGRIRLLRPDEEIELARKIADLLYLEQEAETYFHENERYPSMSEWAEQVAMPYRSFKRRLKLGRRAKEKMVQSNLRLVVSIAKKYMNRGLSFQDLIQEGSLGLVRAAEKFDHEKGYKFSTYATWWIRQAITRAIADQSRTIRLPVHLYETISRIKKSTKTLSQELGRKPSEEEIAERMEMTIEKLRFIAKSAQLPISLETPIGKEEDSRLGDFIESGTENPDQDVAKNLLREDLESVLATLNPRERDVLRLRYGLDDGRMKTLEDIGQIFDVTRERIRQIEAKALRKLRHPNRNGVLKEYIK